MLVSVTQKEAHAEYKNNKLAWERFSRSVQTFSVAPCREKATLNHSPWDYKATIVLAAFFFKSKAFLNLKCVFKCEDSSHTSFHQPLSDAFSFIVSQV